MPTAPGNQAYANAGNGQAGNDNVVAGGDSVKDLSGTNNVGSGTQVLVPDATVQALGKNMADDSATVNRLLPVPVEQHHHG